jgi:hypothetical protein
MKKKLTLLLVALFIGLMIGGLLTLNTKKKSSYSSKKNSSNVVDNQSISLNGSDSSKTNTNQNSSQTGVNNQSNTEDSLLKSIMAKLSQKYPSITQYYNFTGQLDPDGELNKPGGYQAGIVFYDSTLGTKPSPTSLTANYGGTIEYYSNSSDAISRTVKLQSLQYTPQSPGAIYLDNKYLIIVSKNYPSSKQNDVINYISSLLN